MSIEVGPNIWAFDIGSRSIGWAVLGADEEGNPNGEVIDANVIIHSGGVLDEKTGVTRRGDRGVVVRQRRRLRRRVSRRAELKKLLKGNGIVRQDGWRDRNPWWCRHELAKAPIQDPAKLRHLLAIAIPHMARHRGWRNPWLRAPNPREVELKETIVEAANALGDPSAHDVVPDTLGAVCWRLLSGTGRAKIRQNGRDYGEEVTNLSDWVPKVLQDHIASELAYIWDVQSQDHSVLLTDEFLCEVSELVLKQEKPGVPLERIGRCEFDPSRYRAPRASLLYQRYKALAAVGNLRVEPTADGEERRALTPDERANALDRLMSGEPTTWVEIEALLGLSEGALVHSDIEGTSGPPSKHQVYESLYASKIVGIKKLHKWWDEASEDEREVLISLAITDRTADHEYPELSEMIAREIEDLGLLEIVEKFGRSLPPGRASYSRLVLSDLNREMEKGADLYDAKQATYGAEAEGAQFKWEDPVPHGGVEYSMRKIRELIPALERHYGRPVRIGLEIVREATLAHDERRERNERNKRLRESRNKARDVLQEDLNIQRPSNLDITRMEHLTVQTKLCLYCGKTIHFSDAELDHIVPRAIGGSTQFENIAAVCRPCNHTKGDRPFGAWCEAEGEKGATRMEETLVRVDLIHGERWKDTPKKPYFDHEKRRWVVSETERARRAYRRRLRKKTRDPELGEGDLHSTAYVAKEMRERFEGRYPEVPVRVLSGGMTAALRREAKLPRLLGAGDDKDRSDRRHHAVDAITVGLLTHDTWASRVRRRDDAFKSRDLGLISEDAYSKVLQRAPVEKLNAALERTKQSAQPVLEHLVPVYERRLRVTGRIHEDTVRPWFKREIGREWGPVEISSIRDDEVRNALWRISSRGGTIKADPERELVLSDGPTLLASDHVECAIRVEDGGKEVAVATWIPIRSGWCKTDSIHHARLVQVSDKITGKNEVILITIPLADVYAQTDPLTTAVNSGSIALRSNPKFSRLQEHGDNEVEKDAELIVSQGDIVLSGHQAWRISTFDMSGNRVETYPALAGGESSSLRRQRFAAAKFFSGEGKIAERDDLGHITNL